MAKDQDVTKVKFIDVRQNEVAHTMSFIMGNGQRLTFELDKCSEEIKRQAMYHGFNQKIRDAAAGYSKEKDYAGAVEEMQGVIDSLYGNAWNRKGGATSGANMEDLAHAIAEIKGAAFEKAMAAVSAATAEQRTAWGKNPKVAALAAKAKAERLARMATVATAGGDELEGLGDLDENGGGE